MTKTLFTPEFIEGMREAIADDQAKGESFVDGTTYLSALEEIERLQGQISKMSRGGRLRKELVYPKIVPIRILTLLANAGVHTTEQVHDCIRAGSLRNLPGVGAKTEAKILDLYTSGDGK